MYLTIIFLGLVSRVFAIDESCRVVPKRCNFPYSLHGEEYTYCTHQNITGDHLTCLTELGFTGFCSQECLEDDKFTPMDFGGEMTSASVFCKNKASPCIFPFVYKGTEYNECTSEDREFPWCATHVSESSREMTEGMWGPCDVLTCTPAIEPPRLQVALAQFENQNISGYLSLSQKNRKDSSLMLDGNLSGLPPGLSTLIIHKDSFESTNNCLIIESHNNSREDNYKEKSYSLGKLQADENGNAEIHLELERKLFSFEEEFISSRSLLILSSPSSSIENEEAEAEKSSGEPLACALLVSSDISSSSFSWTLLMIIGLSVAIVLLLLLLTLLLCYCCHKKGKPRKEKRLDEEGLPLQTGNGTYKKTPLYDELSIPFIDATPANTPKIGRSFDRLSSFFTRNASIGRSRGSLASNE